VADTSELSYLLWEDLVIQKCLLFMRLLILTGMIKAKKVIEKAPEKLRKRPKFGTIIEKSPVNKTTTLLYIMLLSLGYFEC